MKPASAKKKSCIYCGSHAHTYSSHGGPGTVTMMCYTCGSREMEVAQEFGKEKELPEWQEEVFEFKPPVRPSTYLLDNVLHAIPIVDVGGKHKFNPVSTALKFWQETIGDRGQEHVFACETNGTIRIAKVKGPASLSSLWCEAVADEVLYSHNWTITQAADFRYSINAHGRSYEFAVWPLLLEKETSEISPATELRLEYDFDYSYRCADDKVQNLIKDCAEKLRSCGYEAMADIIAEYATERLASLHTGIPSTLDGLIEVHRFIAEHVRLEYLGKAR